MKKITKVYAHRRWHRSEMEKMIRLWKEGYTYPLIAESLGNRTRKAVEIKMSKMAKDGTLQLY